MRRRQFISGLATAAAWPLLASAQQGERVRRVGLLQGGSDDAQSHPNSSAFAQRLQQLGWVEGQNLRIDYRWAEGNAERARKYAEELIALAPDVVLASSSSSLTPLLQATTTVPIVFVGVVDPVGAGFIESLSRPGGNATGFTFFDYDLSAKWLELLKQIGPRVKRAAILRDPTIASGIAQFAVIQYVAPSAGVELTSVDVRDETAMESAIARFARSGDGGVIVTASPLALAHRDQVVALLTRFKLPAVYFARQFVVRGGLAAYGVDTVDQFRRAASYVDRILRGEKPADLPVQAPTKYELALNLKAAKELGIEIPATLVARADEVIE